MTFPSSAIALVLTLASLAIASPAIAADAAPIDSETAQKNREANQKCFDCHSEAGLKNPPRKDLDLKKLEDVLLEPAVFQAANHGPMNCKECHSKGYSDYPHAKDAKDSTSPCTECHAAKHLRLEPQFDASVHGKNLKGKMSCNTCHDAHVALVAKKLKDPQKIVEQDNRGCLDCHNSDLVFAKFAPDDAKTSAKKKRPDIDTIHDWLPNTKAHWKAVRCVECHTPAVAENKMLSHEIQNKDKAEKKCIACHSVDSSLKTRLYRHLAKEERQQYGFANSVILANSYVVGATRHPVLDRVVIALVILTVFGVLAHGALRLFFAILRKRKTK